MSKMEFYSARVRLGNSLLNEVNVAGVSAAEVILLQHVHGEGSVIEIRKARPAEIKAPPQSALEAAQAPEKEGWSDRVVRAYLHQKYTSWQDEGTSKVTQVFGSSLQPLPKSLDLGAIEAKKETEAERLRAQIEAEVRAKIEQEVAEAAAVAAANDPVAAAAAAAAATKQATGAEFLK